MTAYAKTDEAIAKLTPEQYRVTQTSGTEAPGTGSPLTASTMRPLKTCPRVWEKAIPARKKERVVNKTFMVAAFEAKIDFCNFAANSSRKKYFIH